MKRIPLLAAAIVALAAAASEPSFAGSTSPDGRTVSPGLPTVTGTASEAEVPDPLDTAVQRAGRRQEVGVDFALDALARRQALRAQQRAGELQPGESAAPAGGFIPPAVNAAPRVDPRERVLADLNRQAVEALQQAGPALQPYVDRTRRALAADLNQTQDYAGSVEIVRDLIKRGHSDAPLFTLLSNNAYHMGDYDLAREAASRARALDPNNKEAVALYHFSEHRTPTVRLPSPFALPGLVDASAGAGPAAATTPQSVALAGAPSAVVAIPAQTSLSREEMVAQARAAAAAGGPSVIARSLEITKDAANALRIKDYPTAQQLATTAIELNPQNAQALNFRAISLSRMQRYNDAVQDASAALTLAPGNAAALQTRSWAFAKGGHYKEALSDAEATLSRDPNNAFAYETKALAMAGLHDRAGMLESLGKAAALNPIFTTQYERALQLPQDSDMTLLFDDSSAAATAQAAAVPSAPASTPRRFVRLAVLSTTGGLLIALGVLHVVSASWREKMRLTVRRVLGPSPAAVVDGGAAADSPSMGAFWTQYELVKEIGLGGMGVVYEATDRSLERRVAVKKMRDEIRLDPQDRQRFVSEARMVAQLHNPNIVDIYAIVEDGNDVYLVFEYVEGRTLQDALKSGGPMDLSRARKVIKEMAVAVEHAHERGIIHRDLKPSNVMLTPEGRVKVMDFGVARQAKDALTRHSMTNTIAGTPPYMAPEQEQGTVRKESDVYALGVCLYEMVTGQLPFGGVGAGMLLNKLNGKMIPASQRVTGLPDGFDAVIARALSPDPDKRYHTPAELAAALDALSTTAHA